MTAAPDLLKRWQAAEASLGGKLALDGLPPRLALLARALATLHEGARAPIEDLAKEARAAGLSDIAAVLDVALAPPGGLAPTEVRKRAKQSGADAHSGIPFLDLLRGFAAMRHDETPTISPPLRAAREVRPALAGALQAIYGEANSVDKHPLVRRWSPRAEQAMACARASRLGWSLHGMVGKNFPDDRLRLEGPAWAEVQPGGWERDLRRRIADEPWIDGHDALSEQLYALPASKKPAWLRPMLERIVRDGEAGRWAGLVGLVHAAEHLTEGQPALAGLGRQLRALEMRLLWLRHPDALPPPLASALWEKRRQNLPEALLLRLARELVDDEDTTPRRRREAMGVLALVSDDLSEALWAIDEDFGHLPREALLAVLPAGLGTATRRELLLAAGALRRGDFDEGLRRMMALFGAPEELEALVQRLVEPLSSGRGVARSIRRALPRVLEGGASQPLATRLALGNLVAYTEPIPPAWASAVRATLAAATDAQRPEACLMALQNRLPDVAREQVRLLGRSLRAQPADAADDRALRAITWLLERIDPPTEVLTVTEPLTAFLLREGPARAVAAAKRQMAGKEQLFDGLTRWYLHHHARLGSDPWWSEVLLFPDVPADVPELRASIAETIRSVLQGAPPLTEEEFDDRMDRASPGFEHMPEDFDDVLRKMFRQFGLGDL